MNIISRPEPADRILMPAEVAELFGVAARTITDWARKDQLPHFRTPTGQFRFHESEIRFLLDGAPTPKCDTCRTTPPAGICCSSHGNKLCHRCYRRTHFVEVCVAGCSACAAEGLSVRLLEYVR